MDKKIDAANKPVSLKLFMIPSYAAYSQTTDTYVNC